MPYSIYFTLHLFDVFLSLVFSFCVVKEEQSGHQIIIMKLHSQFW